MSEQEQISELTIKYKKLKATLKKQKKEFVIKLNDAKAMLNEYRVALSKKNTDLKKILSSLVELDESLLKDYLTIEDLKSEVKEAKGGIYDSRKTTED